MYASRLPLGPEDLERTATVACPLSMMVDHMDCCSPCATRSHTAAEGSQNRTATCWADSQRQYASASKNETPRTGRFGAVRSGWLQVCGWCGRPAIACQRLPW